MIDKENLVISTKSVPPI